MFMEIQWEKGTFRKHSGPPLNQFLFLDVKYFDTKKKMHKRKKIGLVKLFVKCCTSIKKRSYDGCFGYYKLLFSLYV